MSTTTYSAHRNRPHGIDANDVDDRVTQLDRALTAQLADARAQIAELQQEVDDLREQQRENERRFGVALSYFRLICDRVGLRYDASEGWA